MGITYLHAHVFARHFKPGVKKSDRVLTLGNQDIHFSYNQAQEFFRANGLKFFEIAEQDRVSTNSHGTVPHSMWSDYVNLLHQKTLFGMMGYNPSLVKSIDIDGYENADIIHDFNHPIPAEMRGKFDLVVDFGTIEHIFDVRQNFQNIIEFLDIGGVVMHLCPANMINHGLYNVNITLLRDVYAANGFDTLEADYVASTTARPNEYRIVEEAEIAEVGDLPGYYVAAHGVFRKREQIPFQVPNQGMYQSLHAAWVGQTREPEPAQKQPEKTKKKGALLSSIRKRGRGLPGRVVVYNLPWRSGSEL